MTPWYDAPLDGAGPFSPYGSLVQGPPRPTVGDASFQVARPADRRVLIALVVGAAASDVAVRSGAASIGASLAIGAVVAAMLATRRFGTASAAGVLAVAPVVGGFLAVRTSAWVVLIDLLAVCGLIGLAASLAAGGSLLDLSIPRSVGRAWVVGVHAALGLGFALGALRGRRRLSSAMVRGLVLTTPIVLVVGTLLASADAVFASFFRVPTSAGDLVGHAVLLGLGGVAVSGLLRAASAVQAEPVPARLPRLGRIEGVCVLAGLCLVYAAFVAAQVVATTGGADRMLRRSGLTYAEHARSGFFQLLVVAALTVAVLLAVRACVGTADLVFVLLGEVAVGLTLVIVEVAVRRLALYQEAYGLTMLRLASTGFALWIGVIFVLLGLRLAGVAPDRAWFVAAAGSAALVALLVWNGISPEAVVARDHLARAAAGRPADLSYVGGLSDDAVPTIAAHIDDLDAGQRREVLTSLCARRPSGGDGASWNASAHRAARLRSAICEGTQGAAGFSEAPARAGG